MILFRNCEERHGYFLSVYKSYLEDMDSTVLSMQMILSVK